QPTGEAADLGAGRARRGPVQEPRSSAAGQRELMSRGRRPEVLERGQKALAASWSPACTSSAVIAGLRSIEAFTAMKRGSATTGIWDGSSRSKKIRPVRLPSIAVK